MAHLNCGRAYLHACTFVQRIIAVDKELVSINGHNSLVYYLAYSNIQQSGIQMPFKIWSIWQLTHYCSSNTGQMSIKMISVVVFIIKLLLIKQLKTQYSDSFSYGTIRTLA